MTVSYIEIYMEELRDLLDVDTSSKDIYVREDDKGNTGTCMCLSVCQSVGRSVGLSVVCLSVCLSVCLCKFKWPGLQLLAALKCI